jgi:hypothetical protein
MMRTRVVTACINIAAVVLLVAICGRGQTSMEPKKASFCDVISSPANYNGKTLSIEATLQSSFHSLSLYDTACEPKEGFDVATQAILPNGWESLPIGKKLRGIIRHGQPAKVRLVGTFKSTVTRGQDGQRFRFSISQIISVSKDVPTPTTH